MADYSKVRQTSSPDNVSGSPLKRSNKRNTETFGDVERGIKLHKQDMAIAEHIREHCYYGDPEVIPSYGPERKSGR